MQVTKELLTQEITGLRNQLEQAKSSAAQAAGAIAVLEGLVSYMDREEEKPKADISISPMNKEVQDRVEADHRFYEAELEAMSLEELAEQVAGPGADVEITPVGKGK